MNIRKHNDVMNIINSVKLHLGYVGDAVVDENWKTTSLATPFNRLYLIESGTGVLYTERETLILEPGKAYLLPAELPCGYHCDGSLSLVFFHFNLSQPDRFDLMRSVDRLAKVDFPLSKLRDLKEGCIQSGIANAFAVTHAVYDTLLEMNRVYCFPWEHIPSYSPCVAAVLADINKNLSAQLRIEDLAQRYFVSRNHLARQFNKEVGVTLKQYINMQIMGAAQWRLSHTEATVEKISGDLGFCNQFYFSKCFKKHCRVSPLQYRNGTRY